MLEKLSLEGKVIIVTGGGTGLGRAMVRALARAGADVCLAARRPGPIEDAAQEVRALGRRAVAVPTDVTDSAQVERMVACAIQALGKVDVLVNNAGLVREHQPKPIWEVTDEEWRVGIDVNLTGAFYCTRAVARHMVERGCGRIINVASGFGLRGGRDIYMYNAAKGGLINLTRALVMSLSRYGITANTIVPGYIPTEGAEAQRASMPRPQFIPVGHFGRPEDLGPVAVFLASDAAAYMNGETIVVDGGALADGYAPTGYAPVVPLKLPVEAFSLNPGL